MLLFNQDIRSKSLFLALVILLLGSCSSEDIEPTVPEEGSITIMPIGDSRVAGDRPDYESYRYELWKNLIGAGWSIDFTGANRDGASYPAFMGRGFDNDHQGASGFTTEDVLATLPDALDRVGAPDIALIGIGGNDLIRSVVVPTIVDNLNEIIDILQSKNDSMTIYVEQIAPGKSNILTERARPAFEEYGIAVANIAAAQSTATSKVIVVDIATGWSEDYLADLVHYNEAGAKVVADKYFEAMAR